MGGGTSSQGWGRALTASDNNQQVRMLIEMGASAQREWRGNYSHYPPKETSGLPDNDPACVLQEFSHSARYLHCVT
jgi:hypothetical protein